MKNTNPTRPETLGETIARAALVSALVILGMGAVLLSTGCAGVIEQGNPVYVSVTDGTDLNPEPQLAVEWPESVRRHEQIVTIQVDGRVISYGPLTAEQAEEFRAALGQ